MSEGSYSTERLIASARQGDRSAANELFARYYPIAMRIAAKKLGVDRERQDEIEEVVQEALHSAYRALDRFECRHEGAFRHYLARIIEHRVVDRRRREDVRRAVALDGVLGGCPEHEPSAGQTTPTEALRRQELIDCFDRWIGGLSDRDRQIFDLRVVQCLTTDESADALGWKASSVRSRLARILAELSEILTR